MARWRRRRGAGSGRCLRYRRHWLGLYCSPWDQNNPRYGTGRAYDDLYITQLTELLSGYGDIAEVWFDGAVGEAARGRQAYDWERIFDTVRSLQPGVVIFSDAGPDAHD